MPERVLKSTTSFKIKSAGYPSKALLLDNILILRYTIVKMSSRFQHPFREKNMRLVKCRMVAFVVFFVLMALSAFAEYYQYRDENGVLIFSDDLSSLPMEQRSQVKVIKEINDGSVDTFSKKSVEPASQDETRVPQDALMQEANELSRGK